MAANTQDPVDPSPIQFPSRRRLGFEAYGDLLNVLKWSLGFNAGLIILCMVLGGVIVAIFARPPYMVVQDQGKVTYTTTEVYKISRENLDAFVREVMSTLLNVNPGHYDIGSLKYKVSPRILDAFAGAGAADARQYRIDKDVRQVFSLYNIKRYTSKRFPKFYTIIIRGELTTYQRSVDAAENVNYKPTSEIIFFAATIEPVRPGPDNPYGLRMVGLTQLTDRAEIDRIWSVGEELPSYIDILQGRGNNSEVKPSDS